MSWTKRAVCLAIATAVAGCAAPPLPQTETSGPESSQRPAAPKRITAAIQSDPVVLSGKIRLLGVGLAGISELERLVTAGLTIQDDRGNLHAQLAEEVPSVENGLWRLLPDGRMEITWRIRQQARWHDGLPFTADDLVFTTKVAQDREIGAFREAAYDLIEAVEAPDSHTVLVRWREPYIEADAMFTGERALPLPRHLLEKVYAEDKANFTQVPVWNEEFIGSGPYRVGQWIRGSHVLLEAYDGYALGRPRIAEIEVRFIPDPSALAANILAGAVELTIGRSLSLEQAIHVRDRWPRGRMEIGDLSSLILVYPQFVNPSPLVIGDVRFRRALLHAADRPEMADTLQAGLVPVAHAFLNPNDAEYPAVERAIVRYDYDPRRASEIIEGLGYTREADGFFRDTSGTRLSVEIRTSQGDDLQEKSLFATANYWQRAGISVDQVLVPPQQAQGREYRATFPGFDVKRQPGDRRFLQRIHSSKTPLPENNFVGNNYNRYRNPEFDALIDRYFVTIPPVERSRILGQIVRHMTDQVLIFSLFFQTSPTMAASRIQGVTGPAQGWNAHQWDVQS